MEIPNTVRIALRAIRKNKVRSGLTMLGVIIGVASVITMIALGSGARAAIDAQIQAQGVSVIHVSSGSFGGGGVRGGAQSITTLTIEDAQAIADEIGSVDRWTPSVRSRQQVVAGNQNWNTTVEGGNEDWVVVRSFIIASGSNITSRDILLADKVCLLGATVAKTLFPSEDPIGQIIRIKNLPFRVAGVLAEKGQGQWGDDQDDFILAPYTTVQRKLMGITYLQRISLMARTPELVEPTAVAITHLLRQRHRSSRPEEDDFTVRTVEEMAAARVQMAQTMTGLLMGVASVSLLVGGIGIMNIMLVSVSERTREIGVRLAVGARAREILRQFLAEALTLSVGGGVIGILLGIAASALMTMVMGWPAVITPTAVIVAFGFSAAVGIFFGWYPARTAASLDPIEALRHE